MKYTFLLLCVALTVGLASGCGPSEDGESLLGVQVYGYGPTASGEVGFQQSLPKYEGAAFVQIRLTQPGQGRLISSTNERIEAPGAEIPETTYGDRLRFELSVLDNNLDPIATGGTPLFDFEPDDAQKNFRMMVMPINDFAPVGSMIRSGAQTVFQQSSFDFRAMNSIDSSAYLGRVGHAVVPVEERNRALVVGGADVNSAVAPGQLPSVRRLHGDLQLLDPVSGYYTDLSYDEETLSVLSGGRDRLSVPRAYHTVTPIGGERYLVVGGLEQRETGVEATGSIELIDLSKPQGQRVRPFVGPQGNQQQLASSRAMHTATYRPSDGMVVVAGGVGPGGTSDIVDTIEFIDVRQNMVRPEVLEMNQARAQHSAVLMNDSTIWLVGGRDDSSVLAATEKVTLSGSSTSTVAGPPLNRARFDAAALRITPGGGRNIMVMGGYTSLSGDVTDAYEFSTLQRTNFISDASYRLNQARGNLRVVELPQTQDLVVLSGRDSGGAAVTSAELLSFEGLSNTPPYQASTPEGTSVNNRADTEVLQLSTGQILLTGGIGNEEGQRTTLRSSEYFNPYDPITASEPAQ